MAKNDRTVVNNKGRVKLRVIEFELDGSDSTLQESIKGILSAINTRSNNTTAPAALTTKNIPDSREPEADSDNGIDGADFDSVTPEAETTTVREKKQRSFKTPQILDIETQNGAMPLKTFCEEKKATTGTDARKYLVIAAWLKEYRNLPDVGADHIYTCYRAMGWHPPKDVSLPFRNMKSQNGWFGSGQERGTYAINHVGLAQVDKT
jgi:hypothetical protein